MMKRFLETGEFVTTHGIAGELKLYPFNDGPEFLLDVERLYLSEDGKKMIKIENIRAVKNVNLVKLVGVNTIEQARAYIGKTVWIDREDIVLEEGSFFVQDLLGASVINADTKEQYGVVRDVLHPGKHDVYEIQGPNEEVYWFPAVKEFLVERNIQEGYVLVRPIEGMFTQEEKKVPVNKKKKRAPKESSNNDSN